MRAILQQASSRLKNDNLIDGTQTDKRDSQYQSLPDANIRTKDDGKNNSHYVTKYKGFNTSITHLLRSPDSSTVDCCSIACCGLLQSDYNRYIIHNRRPPTFKNRLVQYLLIPLAFFCLAGYAAVHIVDIRMKELITWMFLTMTVAWILGGCFRSTYRRGLIRRDLLRKVRAMSSGIVVNSWDEMDLDQTDKEMMCAHYMCGCYSTDLSNEEILGERSNEERYDFFSCISGAFAVLCCGRLARTQWQICGICAVAQEGRQINTLVPTDRRRLDYVTFQSYFDYINPIRKLRAEGNGKLWDHFMALSKLSRMMMKTMVFSMMILLLFSVTVAPEHFQWTNMLVFLATFLQSFFILYFVHWHWNRFDISLDAVVKYFACGFIISTSTAICFEFLESFALKIIFFSLTLVVPASDIEENNENTYESSFLVYEGTIGLYSVNDDLKSAMQQKYPVLSVLLLFCSAYLVAALVEESCKYFGFKMVDHPDFVSDEDLDKAVALGVFDDDDDEDEDRFECGGGFECADSDDDMEDDDYGEIDQPTRQVISSRFIDGSNDQGSTRAGDQIASRNSKLVYKCPQKTLCSTGTAITIAMVSVSLGFACCENLMYIFLYNGGPLYSEIGILISRSLFPVHPLCAAIQSIGVCKQQLENDKSIGIGIIMFPAIMLHGSYDFSIMVFNFLFPPPTGDGDDEVDNDTPLIFNLLPFILSVVYVLSGVFYYFHQSKKQKLRLEQLDTARDQFQTRTV